MKEMCSRSKVIHTREFLLSVKDSAVCKILPTGCESADIEDLLFTEDTNGDSQASDGRWDKLLAEKENPSQNYISKESWRHEYISQCLSKAPGSGCTESTVGPIIQKDNAFQLTKSQNPYRPPHSYKVSKTMDRKYKPLAKTNSGTHEETCNSKTSDPVPTETPSSSDQSSSSKKSNASILGSNSDSEKSIPSERNKALEPIPQRKELNVHTTPGSLYIVNEETYEFPLIYRGGSFLTSLIDNDENEESLSSFDNLWSEISAIIRTEHELELGLVSSNSDIHISFPDSVTVDSEVKICLPDEDSLISIDHVTQTSPEAEFCLPDEDSLITLEDLIGPFVKANLLKSENVAFQPFMNQQKQHSNGQNLRAKSGVDLSCNTWRGNNNTAKPTNFDAGFVQYSVTQQPTIFSRHEGMKCPGASLMPMVVYPPGPGAGMFDDHHMSVYRYMNM